MLVFTVSHRPVLSVRVRSTFVLKAFDYFKWPLNILGNFTHLTLINCQTAHGKSFLAHTLNPRACLKLTCIFFLIVSKGNDKVCKRKNSNLSDITIIIYFWHINAVWQIGYFSFLGDPEGDDLTWIAGLVYWKNGILVFPQCLLFTKPVPEASRFPILISLFQAPRW